MEKLTASNLVRFISQLDKRKAYNYVHTGTKGLIQVSSTESSEGPIMIRRGKTTHDLRSAKTESISSEMIWRVANVIERGIPFNLDRILGASYNTRSVLEALLANTPEFYFCYPGRVESTGGESRFKKGHKHLIWMPEKPHKLGVLTKIETDVMVSEIPSKDVYYEALHPTLPTGASKIDIAQSRRHAQIQIALYFIGRQLGFRTWIAQNDHSITYQNKKILEYEGVIQALRDEKLIALQDEIIDAAKLIDCIWFKNGKLMPAVMEIEHSTGVTSGMTRMKKMHDVSGGFRTRYVVVAPDEIRQKVKKEANQPIFKGLDTLFFPYSAVEELYSLCQRRKIRGVTEEFLDSFMERMVDA
jgi:type II restriction enzyme